jgi:hypothetical protein
MEEVLREPVELTESELDEVAGGNPFSNQVTTIAGNLGAVVFTQAFAVVSIPSTTINNGVDNSVHIS